MIKSVENNNLLANDESDERVGRVISESYESTNIYITLYDERGKTQYSFDPRDREEINEKDLEEVDKEVRREILTSMSEQEIIMRAWRSHSWWYKKEEYEEGLKRWLEKKDNNTRKFRDKVMKSINGLREETLGNIFKGLRWEFLELGLNGIDPRNFSCYEGELVGEMLERKEEEWKKLVYPELLQFDDAPWVRIEEANPPNPRVYVVRMLDGHVGLVQRRGDVKLKRRDMVWLTETDRDLYYEIKGDYNGRGVRMR